jgi:hypothetical protein
MLEIHENNFDVHQYMGEFKESDEYKKLYDEYSEKYTLPFMKK